MSNVEECHPLGLEWLTVIGLPPTDLVDLAASVDCRNISIILERYSYNPLGFPAWSLLDDSGMRREMKSRLAANAVCISLGEGCAISPEMSVTAHDRSLDIFAELGATRVNTVSFDPDPARTFDQFSQLAEMTGERGFELTLEFAPILSTHTLDDAADLVARVGQPHVKILLDTMHFVRAGHRVEDLARFDPALFGYIQISDGPLTGEADYMDEAMNDRMIPGEGEMPLSSIISALPDKLVVSMEVPLNRLALAGVSASERVRKTAEATRALLAAI